MINWTEELSVGVDLIDNQHKELFNRINDLITAIKSKTCKYKIGDVIKFLEDYVVSHFGEEEAYMKKFSYPHYDQHKAQHEIFIANFAALKEELIKLQSRSGFGSYDLSVQTNQVCVDWILEHISTVDKKLGAFLKERL